MTPSQREARPAQWFYMQKVVGWMSAAEIAQAVGSKESCARTMIWRWEKQGLLQSRIRGGTKIKEWRWK